MHKPPATGCPRTFLVGSIDRLSTLSGIATRGGKRDMGNRGLSGLLAFLFAARFLLFGEALMEDLSHHKRSNANGGLGDGGGGTLVIVLPRSFRDDGDGKESRSAADHSGKAPGSSSSSASAIARGALHNESKEAVSCPASCFRPNPVCGVDGVTYWCGSTDAECAGVEVDYVGFCDFGSRGTGGKGGLAIQSFLLVHTIWLMLTAFLVLLEVP